MINRRTFTLAAALLAWPALGLAQDSPVDQLISSLHEGGYVLVVRHAHAPDAAPQAAETDKANTQHERQLDAAGRRQAAALGAGLKAQHIPVGQVLSSPAYRALQTVTLAGLPAPRTFTTLGDVGTSPKAITNANAAFLKIVALTRPKANSDTIVVTQQPNIFATFGDIAASMQEGDALVFKPDGGSTPNIVGRIRISDWTAARLGR